MTRSSNFLTSDSSEKGIALITVMLMMAVMTVLSITMFNTSTIESLISSNYRTSKEAFFDADAGVQYALARIKADLENTGNNIDAPDDINLGGYSASGFNFELEAVGDWTQNNNPYCFTSTGQGSNNSNAKIETCFEIETTLHDIFGIGIVSEKDITISGKLGDEFIASMHANGNILQTAGTDSIVKGVITASGDISNVTNDPNYPEPTEGASKKIIPEITQEVFDSYKDIAKNSSNGTEYISKTSLTQEDLTDQIIFVHGDIDIDEESIVSNTTIIATGDITFNGSCHWNDVDVENVFIAGGDITFHGKGVVAAVFWSNGRFRHNGGSKIYGSIVTAGNIADDYDPDAEFKGGLSFDNSKNINNDFLPKQTKIVNISWQDQSLL